MPGPARKRKTDMLSGSMTRGSGRVTISSSMTGEPGKVAPRRPASKMKTDMPSGECDARKFARVFMNGRSQAVRLPKEFRFDTDRVIVRREGRHVILSPMFKDWDDYFENGARFTDDFFEVMDELRNTHLPLEERESFD